MQTMLTREDVNAILCRLAADQVGADAAAVTLDTHLYNDLNFDSLDATEYAMTIEDELEVSVSDEQAGKVKTVRDAAEMVWPLLGGVTS
jgi:acyl carrier protein